ncbi:MAG: DNA-binding response regulator [Anaerolinea sp.]|nr:DNA-binding response regulator [Anaerolinea sp.]
MSGRRVSVLLIDDHELARRGLEAMLATAGWITVLGGAPDCLSGLEAVERLRPDIVVLDIKMPEINGLECLERLKGLGRPVAVVILTLYDDRRYVIEAIRRGAAGYLLKDAVAAEVIATLRDVADGRLAIEPTLLREALAGDLEPRPEGSVARTRAAELSITPRELEVLGALAEGMTNKEIGGGLGISEDTVKKHVQNLIWKLRAADRTQAAVIAIRTGLLDLDQ